MRRQRGFTLIEVLMVVVILGILSAIVVPQFTRSSQEARSGNIRAQLDMMNNQIELWRARHNGTVPPYQSGTSTSMAGYNWTDMITADPADPNSGGYIKSPPINPVNGVSTVADAFTVGQGWAWLEYPAASGVYRLVACEYDNTLFNTMPGQPGQ